MLTTSYRDESGELFEVEGVSKADVSVSSWSTVASYVSTFPADGGEGACDVDVQVGSVAGVWYLRTRDDAGGSDECGDESYSTEAEAEAAAEEFARDHDESDETDASAEEYLTRRLKGRAGESDPDGEWCVYWETALDDSGPRERYETEEQAEAAAQLAQAGLRANNPGGNLLCGYSVRHLVDGEWRAVEVES